MQTIELTNDEVQTLRHLVIEEQGNTNNLLLATVLNDILIKLDKI